MLRERSEWSDKEYRDAYAEAAVEQGIAWQIKTNREIRGLTQKELARSINTKQSSISRMEDPEYGKHSLANLMRIASAFDCALLVKLVSFSTLARESECLSPENLYARDYMSEIGE